MIIVEPPPARSSCRDGEGERHRRWGEEERRRGGGGAVPAVGVGKGGRRAALAVWRRGSGADGGAVT